MQNTNTARPSDLLPASISPLGELSLSSNVLPMMETTSITVTVPYSGTKEDFAATHWEWTLGGKPFSSWRCYTGNHTYEGDLFIDVKSFTYCEKNETTKTAFLKLELANRLLYDTSTLELFGRECDKDLQGTHTLKLTGIKKEKDSNGNFVVVSFFNEASLKLYPYEHYYTLDEMYASIQETVALAGKKSDRYFAYKSLGISHSGSEIPFAVVAKNKAVIDEYFANQKTGEGILPIVLTNTHSDEHPGVCAMLDIFRELATSDELNYKTHNNHIRQEITKGFAVNVPEDMATVPDTVNVSELLNKYILLFFFSTNPDAYNVETRPFPTGFDPNRDNAYQTQREIQCITHEMMKWLPVSVLDFHGYTSVVGISDVLLIEPAGAPHEPNIEYDLIIDNALGHAHAMGLAALAMSGKDRSYLIPYNDMNNGIDCNWDDQSLVATTGQPLTYGAMSHCIESTDMTDASYRGTYGMICASFNFLINENKSIVKSRKEFVQRALNNIDDRKVDAYIVDAKGNAVGRPREFGNSFFPDYYIIPANGMQDSSFEVCNMIEYALRNSWEVRILSESFAVGDRLLPEGSFVIPLNQLRRGHINAMLYKGSDISSFTKSFSEITYAFFALRGFDCIPVWLSGGADTLKSTPCTKLERPTAKYEEGHKQYVIKNESNASTMAVNRVRNAGKPVWMLTEPLSKINAKKGDFVVNGDAVPLIKDMHINMLAFTGADSEIMKKLPKIKVYLPTKMSYVTWMLDYLGFEHTSVANDAKLCNVIVAFDDADVSDLINEKGVPYIGLNTMDIPQSQNSPRPYNSCMRFLKEKLGMSVYTSNNIGIEEALFNADYAQNSLITAGYPKNGYAYMKGRTFKELPAGYESLVNLAKDNAFISGLCKLNPGDYQGKSVAFTYNYMRKDREDCTRITVFAMNCYSRAHTQAFYNLVSNAIYCSVADKLEFYNKMLLENVENLVRK